MYDEHFTAEMADALAKDLPEWRSNYKPGDVGRLIVNPPPFWTNDGDVFFILKISFRQPIRYLKPYWNNKQRAYYYATRYNIRSSIYSVMYWRAGDKVPDQIIVHTSLDEAVKAFRQLCKSDLASAPSVQR